MWSLTFFGNPFINVQYFLAPNYSRQNSFNRGIEVQKMPPPQAAPLAHTSSSSQLGMLPPPYEMSMMNNAWKNNMPNSNNMNPSMMAQTICEQ